jgi:hypothetical protein
MEFKSYSFRISFVKEPHMEMKFFVIISKVNIEEGPQMVDNLAVITITIIIAKASTITHFD